MADQQDTILIDQARIERARLASALLYGRIPQRRTVNDNAKRLVASIIVAAAICAALVGVAFITPLLSERGVAPPSPSMRTEGP